MRPNVFFTAVSRYARVGAALVVSIVTARALGPADRGSYFLVLTVAALISTFGHLGLYSSNIYEVARDRTAWGSLLANSFWVSLVVGGGVGAIVVAVIDVNDWLGDVPGNALWLAPALAAFTLFFMLGSHLLLGVERLAAFATFEAASSVVLVVFVTVGALVLVGLTGFLALSVLAWGGAAGALLVYLRWSSSRPLSFDWEMFRARLPFAAKAYVLSVCGFLLLRGNVLLLAEFKDPREVGYFSVAAQVGDALVLLPATLALVFFPTLVTATTPRWPMTVRACGTVALTTVLVCGVFALVAGPLVVLAFGDEFDAATQMVYWLLPGVVAAGMSSVVSSYLTALGIPPLQIATWAAAIAVTLALGLLLIPPFGGSGAAAAMTGGYWLLFAGLLAAAYHYSRSGRDETGDGPPPHTALDIAGKT